MSADEENLTFRRTARQSWLPFCSQLEPDIPTVSKDGARSGNAKLKKLGTFSGV